MNTFFFVFLYEGAPMPPAEKYRKRYSDPGQREYTVVTDVQPSVVPGMLRVDVVPLEDDIPCSLHIPINHIHGVFEINSEKAPMGFNAPQREAVTDSAIASDADRRRACGIHRTSACEPLHSGQGGAVPGALRRPHRCLSRSLGEQDLGQDRLCASLRKRVAPGYLRKAADQVRRL